MVHRYVCTYVGTSVRRYTGVLGDWYTAYAYIGTLVRLVYCYTPAARYSGGPEYGNIDGALVHHYASESVHCLIRMS